MTELSEAVEELIDAARYGDYEDVSAALDNKTPVNGTDELGRTGAFASERYAHAGGWTCPHRIYMHMRMFWRLM